jgi:hypothetical protein
MGAVGRGRARMAAPEGRAASGHHRCSTGARPAARPPQRCPAPAAPAAGMWERVPPRRRQAPARRTTRRGRRAAPLACLATWQRRPLMSQDRGPTSLSPVQAARAAQGAGIQGIAREPSAWAGVCSQPAVVAVRCTRMAGAAPGAAGMGAALHRHGRPLHHRRLRCTWRCARRLVGPRDERPTLPATTRGGWLRVPRATPNLGAVSLGGAYAGRPAPFQRHGPGARMRLPQPQQPQQQLRWTGAPSASARCPNQRATRQWTPAHQQRDTLQCLAVLQSVRRALASRGPPCLPVAASTI